MIPSPSSCCLPAVSPPSMSHISQPCLLFSLPPPFLLVIHLSPVPLSHPPFSTPSHLPPSSRGRPLFFYSSLPAPSSSPPCCSALFPVVFSSPLPCPFIPHLHSKLLAPLPLLLLKAPPPPILSTHLFTSVSKPLPSLCFTDLHPSAAAPPSLPSSCSHSSASPQNSPSSPTHFLAP